MARLIDDPMDVSRINRGHIELRREAVDLRQVLELAVEATRPPMAESGHSLPLPEHAPSLTPPPRAATVEAAGSSLRILVVEDNRDGAETLKELLTCMGHEVRMQLDGGGALEAALALQPNLVFVDLGLPCRHSTATRSAGCCASSRGSSS